MRDLRFIEFFFDYIKLTDNFAKILLKEDKTYTVRWPKVIYELFSSLLSVLLNVCIYFVMMDLCLFS